MKPPSRSVLTGFLLVIFVAGAACLQCSAQFGIGGKKNNDTAMPSYSTFRQARKAVVSSLVEHSCGPQLRDIKITPGSLQFSRVGFWSTASSSDRANALKALGASGWVAAMVSERFRKMEEPSGAITLSFDDVKSVNLKNEKAEPCGDSETNVLVELKSRQPAKYLFFFFSDASAAQAFASGLKWFAENGGEASREAQEPEEFKSQAAQWRAANPKPTMPESAHEHQVLAENAIQEKNLTKAIDEYEAALAIFPTWPEGQFNVALLCGETEDYASAVEHMQNYLELAPDAKNAEAARDKIIVWKDKLNQPAQGTGSLSETGDQPRKHKTKQ